MSEQAHVLQVTGQFDLTSSIEQRYFVLDVFAQSHDLVLVIQLTESISNFSSVSLHHGYFVVVDDDDDDVEIVDNDVSLTFPVQTPIKAMMAETTMYDVFGITL